MGLLNFVRSGVREMMIARPEDNSDLIYKHPDRTIPMFAQCTVRADEWAVFAKEGRPLGVLEAGRHTLQANNIPFLSNLVDSFTGGNVLLTELFFVRRTPFPMNFGGTLGHMIDPMTQIRIRGRCHGSCLLRVENPEQMIYGYFGMGKHQEHPDVFNWLTDLFFLTIKSEIGKLAKRNNQTILDIMDSTKELADGFVASCSDLNQVGIRVVKVTKLEIDAPEEDIKRFDQMRQRVADMKMDISVAELEIQKRALLAQAAVAEKQVGVQGAQFDAQARQFQLDQQYQQDARYVQNLAGNYQGYAAGQALMGAGKGMAQGGGNTAGAAAAAQLGIGIGVANMYAQGIGQVGPQFNPANAPRAPVPGMPNAPATAAPVAGVVAQAPAMVQCPGCSASVPPGKFCAECGTSLAPQTKRCGNCGNELAATAKFCAECGTPSR